MSAASTGTVHAVTKDMSSYLGHIRFGRPLADIVHFINLLIYSLTLQWLHSILS